MSVSATKPMAKQAGISITILCHSDNSRMLFHVPLHLHTAEFVEQVLTGMAQGENSERVTQLRNNYEPVLELLTDGKYIELESAQTLAEAGVPDNAICQIAGRPLKEKLMFCRYASQG